MLATRALSYQVVLLFLCREAGVAHELEGRRCFTVDGKWKMDACASITLLDR